MNRTSLTIFPLGEPEHRPSVSHGTGLTGDELSRRWKTLPRLAPGEAERFRRDIEAARAERPPVPKSWE